MSEQQMAKLLEQVPWELLASEYNRRVAAKRKPSGAGGRPQKLRPCPGCGAELGARAMASHKAQCPAQTKNAE